MKILIIFFTVLLHTGLSFGEVGDAGYFQGKVVGLNGDEVTVVTQKGHKVKILKSDIDPPQKNLKVNQVVSVRLAVPQTKSK